MKTYLLYFLFILSLPASAQVKKVLLEEFTTNLCGFCPPKSHDIQVYYENNTSNSVFMTHHAGFGVDSMTNSSATTFASYFQPSTFGFAPAIMIDRDVYAGVDTVPYMPVNGFDTIAQRVAGNVPDVGIDISGSYNASSRQLSITTTATFFQTLPAADRRISIYLVEDSVIGSGPGWDQKCYDANFANQYYPGQYNAGTTYISQYPHRYVQRTPLSGGTWGTSSVIASVPVTNVPYSTSNLITIPANYNVNRLKIVAIVANHGANKFDRKVLNTADISISNLSTTALGEPDAVSNIALFPNPAQESTLLTFEKLTNENISICIFDLTGKLVKTIDEVTSLPTGFYSIAFNTSELHNGMYQVQLKTGKATFHKKLLIAH